MTLDDQELVDALNQLVHEFVAGDYEAMIVQGRLRGEASVIRDYVALFPGQLIMTPVRSQRTVRALWKLEDSSYPDTKMIAVNLWFRDQGRDIEGDLILEIMYRQTSQNAPQLLIYNVMA